MQPYLRSALIFCGAGLSAALLAFVSITPPYSGLQLTMLVIGSLTAGAATMAVEQGFGKAGGPAAEGGKPAGDQPAGGTGSIDYYSLLAPAPPAAGGAAGAPRPRASADTPPLVGRDGDLAGIARLLSEQQEVGG